MLKMGEREMKLPSIEREVMCAEKKAKAVSSPMKMRLHREPRANGPGDREKRLALRQ